VSWNTMRWGLVLVLAGCGRFGFSSYVGPLNGDGGGDGSPGSDGPVPIGDGGGSLATYNVGGAPEGGGLPDFNGDGHLDIAVAIGGNIAVLHGDGAGRFAEAQSLPALATPSWLACGDLNRDGKPDLVVLDYNDNQVVPMINTGTGFSAGAALTT